MRLVSIEMLTPDMVLAFPVYFKNALVLPPGKRDIARYARNLLNMGIQYVYVEDKLSEGIVIQDVISNQTRTDCKKVVKSTMADIVENATVGLSELTGSMDAIIEDILSKKDIQVSLNDIGTIDEYTYLHSVNVAVYSLLMGKELDYGSDALKELAMGTLLHDIGKTLIEPEIQFKAGKLTKNEFERMKEHARIGYYILKKNKSIPENSRSIALSHHERLDGSGYPNGIEGDKIDEFTRITSIADVYDALTSARCYKKKWTAHQAINFLIEKSDTLFEPELVQKFIQHIAIYPNGSMVAVSDGATAIIKEQNQGFPLRPVIRVIKDSLGRNIKPYEVDLMKVLSLTITDSQLELRRPDSS